MDKQDFHKLLAEYVKQKYPSDLIELIQRGDSELWHCVEFRRLVLDLIAPPQKEKASGPRKKVKVESEDTLRYLGWYMNGLGLPLISNNSKADTVCQRLSIWYKVSPSKVRNVLREEGFYDKVTKQPLGIYYDVFAQNQKLKEQYPELAKKNLKEFGPLS